MSKKAFLLRSTVASAFFLLLVIVAGCKNSPTDPNTLNNTSDQAVLQKIADSDSSIASFEPNYNEEDAMSFLGKTQAEIYPFKVGQKIRMVSRDFNSTIIGDSAYATYTKNFEGVLYIAASYSASNDRPDTLIKKAFSSTITRKLIFERKEKSDDSTKGWRLVAISLPEGGTLNSNIDITKMTIFYSNSDSLVISSPNDYFLARGRRWWKEIPRLNRNNKIAVRLELMSTYADTDFVTLTHGGDMHGFHRAKAKFDLVSSTPAGNGYVKVYQLTFETHQFPGYYHGVINAFPRQVIYDDSAAVESNTWGFPYFVKFF